MYIERGVFQRGNSYIAADDAEARVIVDIIQDLRDRNRLKATTRAIRLVFNSLHPTVVRPRPYYLYIRRYSVHLSFRSHVTRANNRTRNENCTSCNDVLYQR